MKMRMIKVTIFVSLLLASLHIYAEEDAVTVIKISDPAQSTGIHIGDVLHRSIALETKAPYQIAKDSLPIKGTRTNGIELVDIKINSTKSGSNTHYVIDLSYQVFTQSSVPVVMQLPAENFAMTGGPLAISTNLPTWNFWFSPLVQGGISTAKSNMQPQQKPSLLDVKAHQLRLIFWALLCVFGLFGIIYVNADRRWLPFMGGVFAQAHRKIKRLSRTKGNDKEALVILHQAFNRAYGQNLFAQDIGLFIEKYPQFHKVRADIENFFIYSNASLFTQEGNTTALTKELPKELSVFSNQLRNCERGV
ncbi:hypothetical protein A7981_08895 [Methylovorus sp. MM2]|nr:hypothetical protein A7981_08895 [Methylovorus sp. MM2]